jgi:hypothetical protein
MGDFAIGNGTLNDFQPVAGWQPSIVTQSPHAPSLMRFAGHQPLDELLANFASGTGDKNERVGGHGCYFHGENEEKMGTDSKRR